MGLFKKVFSRDRKPVQHEKPKVSTALIMLFDALPRLDIAQLRNVISQIEPLKEPAAIDVLTHERDMLLASMTFDDHKLRLVGVSAPVPKSAMERTIPVSNWKQEDKLPLQNHKAHIIIYYDGESPNPTEQLLALYKTVFAFAEFGLLGILDEDAWNCMPTWMLKEQMRPDMLQSCRESVPLGIWTGFVKFFKGEDDVWYCTKGHHRFGVNDLAYLGQLGEAREVYDIFGNLFLYLKGGANIKPGHTAEISESQFLRFREVYEYSEYLNSPLGTLVIEKIGAAAVNRPIK